MRRYLNNKVARFRESVIREMSRVCAQVGGINLAQGFPDYDPDERVKQAAKKAIDDGFNQYAITWGTKDFRDAIARKMKTFNHVETDPEREVTVTCGATEAMICALMATINDGDEVVIFEPFYENFGPDCILSGAKPVYVALREVSGRFTFDVDELRQAFSPKTKAVLINTPQNPLGKVFTREELQTISKLCIEFDALAITDEIYEYILYGGREHVSIASLPGMKERTITISGCSKTYSVTGWRLAYLVAPPEITGGLRKVHDFLTVGAAHPLQQAAAYMLSLPQEFYADLLRSYDERRKFLFQALTQAGFQCFQPEGAYYILTDIGHWLGGALKTDADFALWMAREVGVVGVPASSFYNNASLGSKRLRFTFSKKMETLQMAAEKLQTLRARL